MRLSSSAFADGQALPKKYTEDGENISPPLRWLDVPQRTREFALIMDDPDAPRDDPWVHWVMYGIPAEVRELRESVPRRETVAINGSSAMQGTNSWPKHNIGYRGPAPPKGHGTHHYHFRLYALDRPLEIIGGLGKGALLKAMEGRVLATAEIMGTYKRSGAPERAGASR